MGTLPLSLTGLDPTSPIPGISGEIRFAQGQSAGDLSPTKVLIIAPKTSSGTITADTQIVGPISNEADIITYTGAGSPAHRMGARFLSLCKAAKLYFICPSVAAGSAAVDKITISFSSGSNPTSAGVATIVFCGTLVSYGYTTSDTATTIAAGLVAAFNSNTSLPATATNALGVITITGKIAGEELNTARFRASVTSGTNVVTTVTADTAFGLSGAGGAAQGAGTVSYTSALATILSQKFDYLVPHYMCAWSAGAATPGTSAPLTALLAQVNTMALPATGKRQRIVAGACLTPTDATTLALAMNAARMQVVNQEESPEESYVLAATMAAVRVTNEIGDPSYNFDSYGLKDGQVFPTPRPYNDSAIPTQTELDTMLRNGVTPIGVSETDAAFVVRSITTRAKSGSTYDYRVRDSHIVDVGDKFLSDVLVMLAQSPWTKITDDPASTTDKQPPGNFATPKRVQARIETVVRQYVDNGWFDPNKLSTTLSAIQCGIDPTNSGRMNIQLPAYSAVLLHQMAVLVNESSPPV